MMVTSVYDYTIIMCIMFENLDSLTEIEIENLDINKGLHRFGGDVLTYISTLRSYSADLRSMFSAIQDVDENNLSEYEKIMHSIKGASWEVLATQIGSRAQELEIAAIAKNSIFINKHNFEFLEDLKKLVDDIDEFCIEFTNRKPKLIREKVDSVLLSSLIQACKEYNMSDVDEIMLQIEQYHYDDDGDLVKWLRDKVDVTMYGDIVGRFE